MKIALIACSKSKANTAEPIPAVDLYTGNLFKAQLAYARQVLKLPDDRIFILSAGYGLLYSSWPIRTYDVTLGNMTTTEREEWVERVRMRLTVPLLVYNPAVVFMAGKLYREDLIHWLKNDWAKLRNADPPEIIIPHPVDYGYGQQVAWYIRSCQ